MDEIQQNANKHYIVNDYDINIDIKVLPYLFHEKFNKYKNFGNKIICPKYILYELSNYENVCFPITLKIKDIYLGILEFEEFIDHIYIPNEIFYNLDLVENAIISMSILHKNIDKGNFIRIKPQTEDFYLIENKKKYLEIHLRNLFTTLTKNTIINIPYADISIPFLITECLPKETISINDVDELEVDIEPIKEPKNHFEVDNSSDTKKLQDNADTADTADTTEIEDPNSLEEVSNKFPGKAYSLKN